MKTHRLAIVGSRSFSDRIELLTQFWEYVKSAHVEISGLTIVSGGAMGADRLAADLAGELRYLGVKLDQHFPDWELWGKGAGMIRNRKIVEDCDFLIAFWDGVSPGTKSTLEICRKLKRPHLVSRYDLPDDSFDPPRRYLQMYNDKLEKLLFD